MTYEFEPTPDHNDISYLDILPDIEDHIPTTEEIVGDFFETKTVFFDAIAEHDKKRDEASFNKMILAEHRLVLDYVAIVLDTFAETENSNPLEKAYCLANIIHSTEEEGIKTQVQISPEDEFERLNTAIEDRTVDIGFQIIDARRNYQARLETLEELATEFRTMLSARLIRLFGINPEERISEKNHKDTFSDFNI